MKRRKTAGGMLYQTGYLTIKGCADGKYLLGNSDEEVRRELLLLVVAKAA